MPENFASITLKTPDDGITLSSRREAELTAPLDAVRMLEDLFDKVAAHFDSPQTFRQVRAVRAMLDGAEDSEGEPVIPRETGELVDGVRALRDMNIRQAYENSALRRQLAWAQDPANWLANIAATERHVGQPTVVVSNGDRLPIAHEALTAFRDRVIRDAGAHFVVDDDDPRQVGREMAELVQAAFDTEQARAHRVVRLHMRQRPGVFGTAESPALFEAPLATEEAAWAAMAKHRTATVNEGTAEALLPHPFARAKQAVDQLNDPTPEEEPK